MYGYDLITQNSAAYPLYFALKLASDHASPATGLTPTVTLSKNGGAFLAAAGAVSELGGGWYKVGGSSTDTNTPGLLLLHATATGADTLNDTAGFVTACDPTVPNTTQSGTLQTAGLQNATLASTASTVDSTYMGQTLLVTGGTGKGQTGVITAYVGATRVATLSKAWATPPDATSTYVLLPTATAGIDGLGEVNLNMAQPTPRTPTAGTVGDDLLAAEAQGEGKWVQSGTTLTIYDHAGTTVVRVFSLDSATTPTQRV
jgi:hypothetical protein